jgi:hypothetical protein
MDRIRSRGDSSGVSDAAVDLIHSNRDRWRSTNVSSYEHVFRRICQCPPADVVVVRMRVVNNNVVQITRVEDDSAVPQSEWARYLNVEGVFALLEDHIRKDNAPPQHPVRQRVQLPAARRGLLHIPGDARVRGDHRGFPAHPVVSAPV